MVGLSSVKMAEAKRPVSLANQLGSRVLSLSEPASFDEIVARYHADHRGRAGRELRFFEIQKSVEDAVKPPRCEDYS